jgi:signal transduction histidine kinase
VNERAGLWAIDAAAQQLVEAVVRASAITVASMALVDPPARALTVKAVHAVRDLPSPVTVGASVPLASAPLHRAVLERRQPVHLSQDDDGAAMAGEEVRLALAPGLRSACLFPIAFGDEVVGVLALGEMRSRDRAPMSGDKQQRWLAMLDEFVEGSAPAWEAVRLRRQVRAMSLVARTVWQMLGVRTDQDILGCLGSGISDWLGVPVRGILLRIQPATGASTVATWQLPLVEIDHAQVLFAMARAASWRDGPVIVTRVKDDPLDPLNGQSFDGETWSRVALPLLDEQRLLGAVCLYVQEDLRPVPWELEVFRWLGEAAASWLRAVANLDDERNEGEWLRRVAWELATTHQRIVLGEALDGIARLVDAALPDRLAQGAGRDEGAGQDAETWRRLGSAASREVGTLIAQLREAARPAPASPSAVDANALARRAVEIARMRWQPYAQDRGISLRMEFEPARDTLRVESGDRLLPALAHAIENAVEALPQGGVIRVRVHRDDGHVLISIVDTGPGLADDLRGNAFAPLFSTKGKLGLGLSIVRSAVAHHGGEATLARGEDGGTVLTLRVPACAQEAAGA